MHRVRLLRHHGITPYLVFDGGPLPAKQGTEAERKQRRDENLARANALAAQGKHSQAREYYVKCVDVTPQMAYQLIKVRTRLSPELELCPASFGHDMSPCVLDAGRVRACWLDVEGRALTDAVCVL